MHIFPNFIAVASGLLVALLSMGTAQAGHDDPAGRVARLSYTDGNVSVSPAGERQWLRALRNRPHIRGDRFWTDDRSRAELQMGSAVVRLDENTGAEILNLDDRIAQFELTQGTLNLRVRRLYQGQTYEIDTPTLAFVVTRPGEFRIDVDPRGRWTEVVVLDGQAIAYGERARFPLREGDAIRFNEPTLRDYDVFAFPRPDTFDRFCELRNVRLERSVALRYVPDDLIGYSDLDEYGSWSSVSNYGNVWFPTRVNAGWAPYRNGNWIWQDPWGWTWVDEAEWGFAPFHYGRWVQVDRRWGWIPSSRRARPVYAPALVAFLGDGDGYGGGREPIAWFPLGPRDVYMPSYRASREYFTQINTGHSGFDNARLNSAYSSYSSGSAGVPYDYMYRANQYAVTAVPADVFLNARSVRSAVLPYDRNASAFSEASHIAAMTPIARSVMGSSATAVAKPSSEVFERPVVAHSPPPPEALPFDARREALARNPGRPLDSAAVDTLRARTRGRDADDIRMVTSGELIERPQNEARDATRELERMRDAVPGAAAADDARGRRGAERAVEPQAQRPERDPESESRWDRARAGETAAPETERGRRGVDPEQRDSAAAQRGIERQQREGERDAREQERATQQQAEAMQREAAERQRGVEQAERESQGRQQAAERAGHEQERAAQQQAEAAQRETQRQQREAEQAQREMQRQSQEAERAERLMQQQQQEAERAEREQARDAQRLQQEAEQAQRQMQQQQQEAERAAREQERAVQQQAEAAQREAVRQQRDAERDAPAPDEEDEGTDEDEDKDKDKDKDKDHQRDRDDG